jgi:hypothetical protein
MFNTQQRPVGVKIPEGQLSERSDLPSLTLVHLMPLEFMAAQYVDKSGKKVVGLFVKNGKDWYQAPNGDQWLSQFRALSPKMEENAKAMYAKNTGITDTTDVPLEDNVDVIAGETAGSK